MCMSPSRDRGGGGGRGRGGGGRGGGGREWKGSGNVGWSRDGMMVFTRRENSDILNVNSTPVVSLSSLETTSTVTIHICREL